MAYTPLALRLRTLLAALDGIGLVASVWLAYALRFDPRQLAMKRQALLDNPGLLAWAVLVGWTLATAAELYEPEVLNRRREGAVRVALVVGFWLLAMVAASYAYPPWAYGRGVLALTTVSWALLLILTRWALVGWLRLRPRFTALVVGEPQAVRRFCEALRSRPSAPWSPVDGSGLASEAIPSEVERTGASVVVLAGAAELGNDLLDLHFSGVPVIASSEIWAWLEERLPLESLSPAVFLHQPGFGGVHSNLFNRTTRVLDVLAASAMLLVSLPLLAAAALAILIDDGMPVLFRQDRVGQYGRRFTMWKLRTMRRDAEAAGPVFADAADPRTTWSGRILRRFRLDELPQLVNVLRGEMSLVGPRPERPEFVAELSRRIPYYAYRTAVPPGLTGWAQVNHAYAAAELEDHRTKLELDLYFIRERSLRLYLLTLLRTVSAALVGVRGRVPAQEKTSTSDGRPAERDPSGHGEDLAAARVAPTRL